ncbi:hypothetical protein [Streptomyces griseoaurantiacus]|uniref:hypothetical protein n=1 Tax=Streptomyces griseoaurantiacus TaxID=68213 RepID=UPI0036962C25
MDIAYLMWEETGRNAENERQELARVAALNDIEKLAGELVYRAENTVDLENRLALAEPHLQAVASLRGYPVEDLVDDLKRRWKLLSTAKAEAARKTASRRKVTAAAEQRMDQAVVHLAALAAKDNPQVPMAECLRLATEAVRKHADAYPLAYESWNGTGDGPITDRIKHWSPGSMPKPQGGSGAGAVDPGANGGSSTFDEVKQRLDGLEGQVGGTSASAPSGPSGPSGPTTASLEPTVAGFYQRLKDWWHGPEQTASAPSPAPAAHEERAPYMTPSSNAASDHVQDAVERHHDEQGRREFNDIMRRLDSDQAEMNHKWDTPSKNRFDHPEQVANYLQGETDRRTDDMERRVDEMGRTPSRLPFSHAEPGERGAGEPPVQPVVTDFSHPESGGAGGQQVLPTDPAGHGFSHRASLDHSLFD